MAENDFLSIATDGDPNVLDQADYAASAERMAGFDDGESPDANLFNKMARQAAVVCSQLAQAVCDITGLDMLDNAVLATTLVNIKALFQRVAGITNYSADSGVANAYVFTLAPAPTSWAQLLNVPWQGKITHTNTAQSTVSVTGAAGTKPLVRPNGSSVRWNDLIAGGVHTFLYDGTNVQVLSLAGAVASRTLAYAPVSVANTSTPTSLEIGPVGQEEAWAGLAIITGSPAPGSTFTDIVNVSPYTNPQIISQIQNDGGGACGARAYNYHNAIGGGGVQVSLSGAVSGYAMGLTITQASAVSV